jgi:hypothetical protein
MVFQHSIEKRVAVFICRSRILSLARYYSIQTNARFVEILKLNGELPELSFDDY